MKFQNIQGTEILEFTAILTPDGKVTILPWNFQKLSDASLKEMAAAMGGEVIYPKVRGTFTMPEQLLCTHKDCSQLADKENVRGRCTTHEGK